MAPILPSEQKRQEQLNRHAEVPCIVHDKERNITYQKGNFLGKGGFAHCYELRNMTSDEIVAGKIVSKSLLVKQCQRDKMSQEIRIHSQLRHENIVRLYNFFEDARNVYITLELCARRSLMELHKRRKAVTDPEARYFTVQVCKAVDYLHDKRIIHRDLKLGNLFLNEEMMVKIGDFGLATIVNEGERKKTLCGTPNYIAPEVLEKKGHSLEVDVWAIGCILYTLLFGKPPFETDSIKETYARIKDNFYRLPADATSDSASLIRSLLSPEPSMRPSVKQALLHEYFEGFTPRRLPVSCLSMTPKFDLNASIMPSPGVSYKSTDLVAGISVHSSLSAHSSQSLAQPTTIKQDVPQMLITRRTSNSHNSDYRRHAASPARQSASSDVIDSTDLQPTVASQILLANKHLTVCPTASARSSGDDVGNSSGHARVFSTEDWHLSDLHYLIIAFVNSKPVERSETEMMMEDMQSPKEVPVFWIAKWVDYSDKYGIGYTLSDNSVGVVFNDNTRLVLDEAGALLTYFDKINREFYYSINDPPKDINKKVTLLRYFRNYMNEHLMKSGKQSQRREGDDLARLPVLQYWFRTRSAMIFHLSNGSLQINFFHDHIKMVICPLMQAVTFIDPDGFVRTYKFIELKNHGCSRNQMARLRYASTILERLKAHVHTKRFYGKVQVGNNAPASVCSSTPPL